MKIFLTSVLILMKRNFLFFFITFLMSIIAELEMVDMLRCGMYEYTWMEIVLDLFFVSLILSFFSPRWRSIFHGIIYSVIAAITITDIFCVFKFSSHITPTMMMLFNETDSREAGEFLSEYVTEEVIFDTPIIFILTLTFIYMLTCLPWRRIGMCILPQKIKDSLTIIPCKIKAIREKITDKAIAITKYILSVGIFATLITCICFTAFNRKQAFRMFTMQTIGEVEHELTTQDQTKLFCSLERLFFSARANMLTGEQLDILKDKNSDLKIDGCSYTSPNIVLIIGEAYCRDHSQLYGYNKETTPCQKKLEQSGQLTKFTDVIAPWNLTSYVFKHIMTTYTVGDDGAWCDYPLWCRLYRESGYNVRFLTNEFLPKPGEAVYDFSGGFFINDPVLNITQFDERNTELHRYDEDLLSDYDALEKESKNKDKKGHLTIFHLMGQHQSYKERCPQDKMKFRKEDYSDRDDLTDGRWRWNTAYYDNATRYNDSVVNLIVNKFADENTIVIYMPDHGEEVHPKESPSHYGRYHSAKIDKLLAYQEFTIPFWIYCSKKYISSHPDIYSEIKAAADKPYMTDALPHLMLYLAGIKCPYYREDRNILSPKYDTSRKRIIKHEADYDEIVKK